MSDENSVLPDFPFEVPRAYYWIVKRRVVGFDANTRLQPWYFLDQRSAFSVSDRWPRGSELDLFAFARRQDCDDIACFEAVPRGRAVRIIVVHGWTSTGYDVVASYDSLWEWLKSVIDDIAEWVDLDDAI